MKIGIDARLWNETGVGRYIRNLVKFLQNVDKKNEYILFVKNRDYDNVKCQISNIKYQIKTADIRWHSVSEQFSFLKILNKENLDLMHFPYFSLPVMYNRPFVVTIHDLIIHHFPTGKASTLPLPVYKIKHFAYRQIVKLAVKKAKKVIVPLNATKEDLIKSLNVQPDKIAVTYEGVGEEISNVKYPMSNIKWENRKYFLYVGNAYPHKNLEILLSAFRKLQEILGTHPSPLLKREGNQGIKLLLVGKKDYFYSKLEAKLKFEKNNQVLILHDVSDTTLSELYRNAIATITPSFMEGFGLVPLEAMANKCLVIASDIPAHKEVCRDAALYFDPNSVDDLTKVIEKVCYYDSNHRNKFNKAGLDRVKSFSWQKMAEETLQLYEQFKK